MVSGLWRMLKETILAFIEDEALSRGAAIAFYTVTSIAPVLLIVIAIAGLVFGHDAAQNAITTQLSGLMGQQTAEVLQTAVASRQQIIRYPGHDCWDHHFSDHGFWRFWRNANGSKCLLEGQA